MSAAPPVVAPYPFTGGAVVVPKGKSRKFRFLVTDRLTLVPVDVTAWSAFKFLAKTNILDTDVQAVITKTLGAGVTVITPAASGVLEVLIAAADTSGLADQPVHLFAEFQGVDPTGAPWALWQGELDIVTTVVVASS